jgi:homocysteine S-methyltransferase
MADFLTEIGRRVLVGDGGMGTMLHAAGHAFDGALGALNRSNPAVVSAVHDSYVAAGADIIQTNTFGASRLRLALHGHAADVREINLAGAKLACEARAVAGRSVLVAGSVSPAVTMGQRPGIGRDERVAALREQMESLVAGGVDLLVLETFAHLEELVEAVEVASEFGLPIVAQATFNDDGILLGGDGPGTVARVLREMPVAMIGANCTVGPRKLVPIVRTLSENAGVPVSVQPNAGLPQRSASDHRFHFAVDAAYFASHTRPFVEAGAALVGGCCGTTPAIIRSIADEVRKLPPQARRAPIARAERIVTSRPPEVRRPTLKRSLANGEFTVAVEITPPAGGGVAEALTRASRARARGVELFVVPSTVGTRAQISPLSLAIGLKERTGVEPILSVPTWDRSLIALQADILGAHALEVRNIACETGQPLPVGDYPVRDAAWETDSLGLIALLRGLNQGRDCTGLSLETSTSFVIGAWCDLGREVSFEIERTRSKVRAGAEFLLTRPIYEIGSLETLCRALAEEGVPVVATVRPLESLDEAEYLFHEVPDVRLPRPLLDSMRDAGAGAAGHALDQAAQLVREVAAVASGVVLSAEHDAMLGPLLDVAFAQQRT